jgi:hypothetical protein
MAYIIRAFSRSRALSRALSRSLIRSFPLSFLLHARVSSKSLLSYDFVTALRLPGRRRLGYIQVTPSSATRRAKLGQRLGCFPRRDFDDDSDARTGSIGLHRPTPSLMAYLIRAFSRSGNLSHSLSRYLFRSLPRRLGCSDRVPVGDSDTPMATRILRWRLGYSDGDSDTPMATRILRWRLGYSDGDSDTPMETRILRWRLGCPDRDYTAMHTMTSATMQRSNSRDKLDATMIHNAAIAVIN